MTTLNIAHHQGSLQPHLQLGQLELLALGLRVLGLRVLEQLVLAQRQVFWAFLALGPPAELRLGAEPAEPR